jgi:AcrR family transcriptional regulator
MNMELGGLTKGERTKSRIIQKSISTIARFGFEGVILSDIAKAADVTRASIIQYFGSREELIEQTIRHLDQNSRPFILEFMTAHSEITNLIERYVRANFSWARSRRDEAVLLVYLMTRASYDRRSQTHVTRIFSRARETLAGWISSEGKDKSIGKRDNKALALKVHSALLGFFVLLPFESKNIVDYYESQCIETVQKILS